MSKMKHLSVLGFVGLLLLRTPSSPASVIPILAYNFNQTGSSVPSSGSDSTAVVMHNSSNTVTDLHGGPGSGVSGGMFDLAFDNTASAFGGVGGYANQADNDAIDGLKSFTLEVWYNASVALTGTGARLISNYSLSPSLAGFDLNNGINGAWTVYVNNVLSSNSSFVFTDAPGTWVFLAATYDSNTGVVNFYKGTKTSAVVSAGSAVPAGGTISNETAGLDIGNFSDPIGVPRAFQGLIDDVRIFGSKTDSSGALSLTDLEAIRESDLVFQTPEPASLALLGIGGMLALRRPRQAAVLA